MTKKRKIRCRHSQLHGLKVSAALVVTIISFGILIEFPFLASSAVVIM